MYDDAQDALAAEYVLGTLSADEREHAEALLTLDPGFATSVRQWERRLGELNVMVEAVEPPPEVWDKIKAEIGTASPQSNAPIAPSLSLGTDVGAPTPPLTETPAGPTEPPAPSAVVDEPSLFADEPGTELDPHTARAAATNRRASRNGVGFHHRLACQVACRAGS